MVMFEARIVYPLLRFRFVRVLGCGLGSAGAGFEFLRLGSRTKGVRFWGLAQGLNK